MRTSTLPRAAAALLIVAGVSLAATPARGETPQVFDDGASYVVDAEVVRVTPRYGWHEVSEPVRECVEVARSYPVTPAYGYRGAGVAYRHDDGYGRRRVGSETAAGLVGGLIGGLVGNQFGGGRGRTALTVAGAMLGASIATDHVRRSRAYPAPRQAYAPVAAPVERCRESYRSRQVRGVHGYDVTYRYQGRTFTKRMAEHPGDTVPVRVAVDLE